MRSTHHPLLIAAAIACAAPAPAGAAPDAAGPVRLEVTFVTDEAEAVLSILAARAAGRAPGEPDWRRLFSSQGYLRLARREAALGRPLAEEAFRSFVLSEPLAARSAALARTLEDWVRIDLEEAARRAFAYLPGEARLRATIYPVIKPKTNSFVFETDTDPAIFLYLDPEVPPPKLANTIAHELHHIGVGSLCAPRRGGASGSPFRDAALAWMGGFAEGRAMLAAAGGPDAHPHADSPAAERAVWERDLRRARRDLGRMERFFLGVMDGRYSEEEATRRGMRFIDTEKAPQGPFYTLGWLMAATIERRDGRGRLVASLCDPAAFLADYDRAAREAGSGLPLWSGRFLARLRAGR